nr:uncharacterized protein LOC129381324 [Dermacentor andersoni]
MPCDSVCFCHETGAGAPEAPKPPSLKEVRVDTRLLHLPSATKQRRAQARNSSRALHGLPCHTTICDDSFEDLWNALNSHNDASDVTGHTHVTESGISSSRPMVSSSCGNHAQPSTSRAGLEEESAVPENIARQLEVS